MPDPPGGFVDASARILSDSLAKVTGQSVVIDNRGGGSGKVAEFIAYLKANSGKLSYASQGNGSLSHIGTEMFKQQTGTRIVHIPYLGSGPAIQDMLSGRVQLFITTPPSVMGHVLAGKLKGLAAAGKTRHPNMPNLPTASEAGLRDLGWGGIAGCHCGYLRPNLFALLRLRTKAVLLDWRGPVSVTIGKPCSRRRMRGAA